MIHEMTLNKVGTDEDILVYFDNIRYTIKNADGTDFLDQFDKFKYEYLSLDKRICIFLGFNCNMNCSYCVQPKNKKESICTGKLDEIIESMNNRDLHDHVIEFWGGEPLLYWDAIEYVLERLKDGGQWYRLITNGLKLDLEKAKKLVKWEFNVNMSHDAKGQYRRGVDPLDKPAVREAIEYIVDKAPGQFVIATVMTPESINTQDRIDFYIDKLGEDVMKGIRFFGGGPVVDTLNNPLNKIENLEDIYYEDMKNGAGMFEFYHHKSVITLVEGFNNEIEVKPAMLTCQVPDKELYTLYNLDGAALTCHSQSADSKAFHDRGALTKCMECPVALTCKTGCPAVPYGSPMFNENCSVLFTVHKAQFRMAVNIITNWEYELKKIITMKWRSTYNHV